MFKNRTFTGGGQAVDTLDWLAKNLDATNDLVLAHLRRGGNEQQLLTQFFAVLRAKRAIHDGLAALRELEGAR